MAARNLKRKRASVSYREVSSDEDISNESEDDFTAEPSVPTPRRRSARTSAERPPIAARSRRHPQSPYEEPGHNKASDSVRLSHRKRVQSYREPDTDEDMEDEDDSENEEVVPQPRIRRPRASPKPSRRRRTRRIGVLGAPLKSRRPRRSTQSSQKHPQPPVTDGKIPAWSSLPYHVLLQVFVYASHPLHDENFVQTSSVSWLLNVASLCSTFTKPALTALYRNPPIFSVEKTRRSKLVRRLTNSTSNLVEDYQVMVKRLEIDGTKMSALTTPGNGDSDLITLITSLSTLKDIDFFDPLDRPPYRKRFKSVRWHYPDELFAALRNSSIHVKSWRWNTSFASRGLLWIKDIHSDNAFCHLEDLTFTNYQHIPIRFDNSNEPTSEELLASALATLPKLKTLTFESCTIVNENLLPLLPHGLVSLNITNCGDLTSDALNAFLLTHGDGLQDLTLNHNQSLDISFLVDLKRSCPRLESLKMDLNYYNSFATAQDSEPKYVNLLNEEDIPSWPSTLRTIDMVYLRKWTASAAEAFFCSIIDSAEQLPHLRELELIAMVDINWRDRATFRKQWIDRFRRVFLRKNTLPSPHLVSLRAFREWKATRPRTFINEASNKPTHDQSVTSNSDEPILAPRHNQTSDRDQSSAETWRSQRLRTRVKPSSQSDTSDGDADASDDAISEKFIQGMCRAVEVRIDNLRPREEMFSENDFLDEEVSGDEDWNGQDLTFD